MIMDDTRDYAVTMFGLAALQMPTFISMAPKNSSLSVLQKLGFPFNMSNQFMKVHIAFSPGNVLAGRYYTLVTNIFYHNDINHLLQNIMVLAACGKPVHKKVGRQHFLTIFTGGGLFGNLGIWLFHHIQRQQLLQAVLPYFDNHDTIVDKLNGKYLETATNFYILNSAISCCGSSAGVNAILSFGACCSLERVAKRLRAFRTRENLEIDIPFFLDVFNIVFTLRVFSNDIGAIMMSFLEVEFFEQIKRIESEAAYVGPGHVAGMLFGITYYYFMYIR